MELPGQNEVSRSQCFHFAGLSLFRRFVRHTPASSFATTFSVARRREITGDVLIKLLGWSAHQDFGLQTYSE
jgi:hypothetical protein